jgi:signal transduction histidine kinase
MTDMFMVDEIFRLEAELNHLRAREADLTAEVGRLTGAVDELQLYAGTVAHDLKGPLVTIDGYVQLLHHAEPGDDLHYESLTEIARAVGALRATVDGHLADVITGHAPIAAQPVDLTTLVEDIAVEHVLRAREQGKPIPHITVNQLGRVGGDESAIRRVFDNLICNAVKYTLPGAPATVVVSACPDASGFTRVEVADRGIGIPEAMRDGVFARFGRAHCHLGYPGTGLGLFNCRTIVHRHGGEMGCGPNSGTGTLFWLTLPLPR